MGSAQKGLLGIICLFLLFSCAVEYDNPGDVRGINYQGYEVVESVEDVEPVSLGSGEYDMVPSLTVTESLSADAYWIQISGSGTDFGTAYLLFEKDDYGSNVSMDITEADITEGTWYWRVCARDADTGVWGAWSAVSSFTALGPDLADVSPADGGSAFDTTPLLDWGDIEAAEGYEVQFGSSGSGLTGSVKQTVGSSQYQVPVSGVFGFGESCYWRVRTVTGDGGRGIWSSTVSTLFDDSVLWEGLSPAEYGSTADTTPLFNWADVDCAESYNLQFSTASASDVLNGTILTSTDSQYQLPLTDRFSFGSVIYWHVQAVNDDGGESTWSDTFRFEVSEPFLDLVFVSGGSFYMGTEGEEYGEGPAHLVTLSPFYIGKYEVTQALYEEMIGTNPSAGYGVGDNYPVYNVTWYKAIDFCNAMSDSEGLDRCYTVSGTTVTCDFSKNGYRLPTEAEWEFAARGGNSSNGYLYAGSDTIGDVAWYYSNSGGSTHQIGIKAANELGIHDMSGNIGEWCWDWYYYYYYSSSPEVDPEGASSSDWKVIRGGYWNIDADYCRTKARDYEYPGYTLTAKGIRVVRRP